jgi:hypothetical protein
MPDLEPMLTLLTLPDRPEALLKVNTPSLDQPTWRPGWKSTPAEARPPLGLQVVRPCSAQKALGDNGPSPLARRQRLSVASGVPPHASRFPPMQVSLKDSNTSRIAS